MGDQLRVAVGQVSEITDEIGAFAAQLGTPGVQIWPTRKGGPAQWTFDDLTAAQARCDELGIRLEAIAMHFYPRAMLGLPGRDEQIDDCIKTVENMGRTGVRIIGYDWEPNGVWRTSWDDVVRPGAVTNGFDMAIIEAAGAVTGKRLFGHGDNPHPDYLQVLELPEDHIVTDEEMWANYQYFLDAVLPVAEKHGVMLAVHPADPPVPMLGGIARVLRSPDAYRRAMEMANSPAWGVLLCQGSVSEQPGGASAVLEMIDTFGPIGKIGYIHFRDVQGTVPKFRECFLGDGNYDPVAVMLRLREVGYTGFVIDDHVPHLTGDAAWNGRARGHAMGYLQGLIRATQ